MSETAHEVCFKEKRPVWAERFDFVLLLDDEDTGIPYGYVTCFEIDAGKVWIHFGGAFPSAEKNMKAVRGFHQFINYLRERYVEMRLDTKNSNLAMIKLAYSAGFVITGIDYGAPDVYLRMTLECE